MHLLAAFAHVSAVVLGQTVVDGKTNEMKGFAPPLDRIDITGTVITADAFHTQHRRAQHRHAQHQHLHLHERGAHHVLIVRRNHPGLRRQLTVLPWAQVPAVDVTRDRGHRRVESHILELVAVSAGIGFPHARPAIQLTRRRGSTTSARWHTEIVYAVTDLGRDQIGADQPVDPIRRHRHIENRLHRVRDVVFAGHHLSGSTTFDPACGVAATGEHHPSLITEVGPRGSIARQTSGSSRVRAPR